jgi:hypothetical protein
MSSTQGMVTAGLEHVQDAEDHPPVVHVPGTGLVPRQVQFDRRARLV